MTTGAALQFDTTLAFVLAEALRRKFPEGSPVPLRQFGAVDHARLTGEVISLAMEDPDVLIEDASAGRIPTWC